MSWEIRSKLRPLNISPEEMYKDRRTPTCVRPRVVNRIKFHFPVSQCHNRVDNRIGNNAKIIG